MRGHSSFRHACRRHPGWSENWLYKPAPGRPQQEFGDVTSLVNALRNRRLYQFSSLRLLADLVEVMRESEPRHDGEARVRGLGARAIRPAEDVVLRGDSAIVRRAAASSPCLLRSFALGDRPRFSALRTRQSLHRLLLCKRDGLAVPVAPLAHLLAAAIAAQFEEPAAAVTFTHGRARMRLWTGHTEIDGGEIASFAALQRQLAAATAKSGGPAATLIHVIVAAPGSPARLPKGFIAPPGFKSGDRYGPELTTGYDRIVYLCDRMPKQVVAKWEKLLAPTVRWRDAAGQRDKGPFFGSFVPSLVGIRPMAPQRFDTRPVDDEFQTPRRERKPPEGWRLERDHCRIPFEVADWRTAPDGSVPAGFAQQLLAHEPVRELADAWARAVTNRRVGMALSGGGASSFRLIPIIRGIHRAVPIDIVSGCSGGALLGAYYCRHGLDGLVRCVEMAKQIGVQRLAQAFFDGAMFEQLVDGSLGRVDVTATRVRLAALTTALLEHDPPEAHVVTSGSLGEAVQVSGAAPVLFAPVVKSTRTHKNLHFSDGAMSAFVPARILRDCGADFVLAFNCLSGPERRNPLDKVPYLRHLARTRFAERLVDLWIAGSFLAQRIGRETDEDAHVYYEPDEEAMPLVESFNFTDGQGIARRSFGTKERQCIRDCKQAWTDFRTYN